LDLEVARGEIFGFLGPNGAGKTTTIRLLLDLIRPTRGRASVLGLDAQSQSLEVRRHCGYLPGDLKLPEHRTARSFLSYLGHLRGGVPGSAVEALAAGVVTAAWMLDGLGQAVDALDPWRPLSPYYQALGPLRNGAPWGHWALLVVLTVIVLALAAWGLERRDLEQ